MLTAIGKIRLLFYFQENYISGSPELQRNNCLSKLSNILLLKFQTKSRNYNLVSFQTTKSLLFLERYEGLFDTEFNYLEKPLGTNQIIRYYILTKTESNVFNEVGLKNNSSASTLAGSENLFFVLAMCIPKALKRPCFILVLLFDDQAPL